MKTIALIVAAGRGKRFDSEKPKQYQYLGSKAVLTHSLESMINHPLINEVRVIIHPEDMSLYNEVTEGLDLLDPVFGGKTRQESVLSGLESIKARKPEIVIIHDAARPFVTDEIISSAIENLYFSQGAQGAIAAIEISDSLKKVSDNIITGNINRENIWRAQTPQVFRFNEIYKAHKSAVGKDFTDDASVAENSNLTVSIVKGSENNIKITNSEDLIIANNYLSTELNDIRTGIGFDVHKFISGDSIKLCGINIPHTKSLEGHSDADVAFHSVTDAILSALGDGDIGMHFPPNDTRWKNADSAEFLSFAMDRLTKRGGFVSNLNLLIICEYPKISPHRDAMINNIYQISGIDSNRINIQATTTEKLGFLGRGEGIGAQSTVLIRLPSKSL